MGVLSPFPVTVFLAELIQWLGYGRQVGNETSVEMYHAKKLSNLFRIGGRQQVSDALEFLRDGLDTLARNVVTQILCFGLEEFTLGELDLEAE